MLLPYVIDQDGVWVNNYKIFKKFTLTHTNKAQTQQLDNSLITKHADDDSVYYFFGNGGKLSNDSSMELRVPNRSTNLGRFAGSLSKQASIIS